MEPNRSALLTLLGDVAAWFDHDMLKSRSPLRSTSRRQAGALIIALSLVAAACGSTTDGAAELAADTSTTEAPAGDAEVSTQAAILFPIDAGELENWKTALADLSGPNYADYEASRTRFGLTQQTTVLQETPMGNFALIYMEGADLAETSRLMATSTEVWDIDWREMTTDLHGVDFNDETTLSFDTQLVLDTGDLSEEDKQATTPFNFFIPLAATESADIRAELEAVMAERGDEYRAARAAIGVAEEKVFLQNTVVGPGLVIYWEAVDPQASLEQLMAFENPYDVWFAAEFGDHHAIPTEILATIWAQNELIADFPARS
ncbi:MAG: hypothetical protein ACRBK7_16940 [Acidimicrobiales bacterium]